MKTLKDLKQCTQCKRDVKCIQAYELRASAIEDIKNLPETNLSDSFYDEEAKEYLKKHIMKKNNLSKEDLK